MTESRIPQTGPECAMAPEDVGLLLHELRAPMTAIIGYSDMLHRATSDEERERLVDGLRRAVVRMDAMLEAASTGAFKPRPRLTVSERVDLCALAQEAVADLLASSAMEVSVRSDSDVFVFGDALLLRRAVDNLLSNASRYGGGGPVEVAVRRNEEIVTVAVSDRGPGIPQGDRERILRPFERLERDSKTPGTGLGLSVVASVVEAHNGRVRILDREGGGTTVQVELGAER